MNKISPITEKELLKKFEDGVSKNVIWQKPLLLLTKNGSDYTHIMDTINKRFHNKNINTDALHYEFVRNNDNLKLSINGVICDGHHPEIDFYDYLGEPLGFDEKIHRYCIDLIEYEAKPVISYICITDKGCSVEEIPAWIKEKYEIFLFHH